MNGAFRGAIIGSVIAGVGVPLGGMIARILMANAGLILTYFALTSLYDSATGHTARVEQVAALTPKSTDFTVSRVNLVGNDTSYRLREITATITSHAKIKIANPRLHCTYSYTYYAGGPVEDDAMTSDAIYQTINPGETVRVSSTRMSGNVLAEIRYMRNVQCTVVDFENLFVHQALPR